MPRNHFEKRIAEVRNRALLDACAKMAASYRARTPASSWKAPAKYRYTLYLRTDDLIPDLPYVGLVDMDSPWGGEEGRYNTSVLIAPEGQPWPIYGAIFDSIDTTRPSGDAFRAMVEAGYTTDSVTAWQKAVRELSDLALAA